MASLPFGYVYDERMLKHVCKYDGTMAERPERMALIHERLKKDGLLEKAVKIEARPATDAELMRNHPPELLRELEQLKTEEQCEEYCRDKEILWMSTESEQAARLAAGGTIDLVRASVERRIGNGFAIVRPPSHHAYGKTPQGYCVFNNVAVAAKYAVEEMGLKKVAVIDFDYHPGNGTFHSLDGDERYLFSSIHAYHHGAFWPFTEQFDYDTKGNQVFFPLNGAQNSEGDYAAAFNHVLIPILKEWKPELILLSAGFDAGYYDIMMQMGQAVKAHGFGHLTRLLNDVCPDRTVAVLEGGYFPANYTESAAMTTRALRGLPLPALSHPATVSAPLSETIWCNVIHHSKRFKCMQEKLDELQKQQRELGLEPFKLPEKLNLGLGIREMWDRVKADRAVRTREWFPELSREQENECLENIRSYIEKYDYSDQPALSHSAMLSQLIWNEQAKANCFLQKAGVCSGFVSEFTNFVNGTTDQMLICDRMLYEQKTGKKL